MTNLLILASLVVAQPAEVRLNDGSVIAVTLASPQIKVATKYGTLDVPISDIRKIDFGWHLKDKSAVDRLIASLASAAFKDRDDGTKVLKEAGASVYAVLKAYRSQDQEQMKRLEQIIVHIEQSSAHSDIIRPVQDSIATSEFPITGLVQGDFEATSVVFGKVKFSLSDIRSITMKHPPATLAISAGGVDASWLDSGITIDGPYSVTAEGQVDLWPGQPGSYMSTPKGFTQTGKNSSYLAGSLIGRIGEHGSIFVVGERYEGTGGGRLYLQIVPNPWGGAPSAGSYNVKIKR